MRGRKYKRRETGKHGRRLLLAGLIVAAGQFAKAETPVAMVPLPLTPLESGPAGVRSNPFCQPVVVEAATIKSRHTPEPVQVARLQAFGGAGEGNWHQPGVYTDGGVVRTSGGELQRRDQPASGSEGLRSYLQSPMIETAGGVRANPLATQFKATDPPEPKVDYEGVRALKSASEKSSGISFSFSDDDSTDEPLIAKTSSEPIELSLSDDSTMSVDEATAVKPNTDPNVETKRPSTRPTTPWFGAGVERAPAGLPEPINLRALEPAQFSTGRILQVPLPEPAEFAAEETYEELSPLDEIALPSDNGRLVNGGRPRVEVGRPTVAVDRMATMSIIPGKPRVLEVDTDVIDTVAAIQPVQSRDVTTVNSNTESVPVEPAATKAAKSWQSVLVSGNQPPSVQVPPPEASDRQTKVEPMGAGDAATIPTPAESIPAKQVDEKIIATFNLKPTEVRAIKIESPVSQVHSDNLAVCAVIKAASGQIQLLATGVGSTRLSVHTVGADGVEAVDRYEVTVGEVRAATVDSPESIAMTLTQTVQNAFPGSNVLVSAEGGRLIVTGSCPDEDVARRMLRMIRSACAAPVVDRVKVR